MINGYASLQARRLLRTCWGATALRATLRAARGLSSADWATALHGGRVGPAASMQLGGRRFSSTPPASEPIINMAMVKVGNGEDCDWDLPVKEVLRKTRGTLLKALRDDALFHHDLKGVSLTHCKVFLLRHVAGKRPTAEEELCTVELEQADTIGNALQVCKHEGDLLYIRVHLPGRQPLATATPYSEDRQIPKSVWDRMGPLAQVTAATAAAQRSTLASLSLLKDLGDTLPVAQAVGLGVTVLHQEDGNVSIGLFKLPKLVDAVQEPPKSDL